MSSGRQRRGEESGGGGGGRRGGSRRDEGRRGDRRPRFVTSSLTSVTNTKFLYLTSRIEFLFELRGKVAKVSLELTNTCYDHFTSLNFLSWLQFSL